MSAPTLRPPGHSPRRRAARLAAALLLCAGGAAEAAPIAWKECTLPKLSTLAQCATLDLPAAESGGASLKIHVTRLPSLARRPKSDPVFLLAGGPGQAASALVPIASVLGRLRDQRDIVMVDQRGTGRSHTLRCGKPLDRSDDPLQLALKAVDDKKAIAECVDAMDGDPRLHTTADYLRDLEAVRKALGYEQLNLWGGSYGTRVAQDYLRRYPAQVRTVVLDGVAAPELNLLTDLPVNAETALRQLYSDCARDPACKAAYPDGFRTFETVSARLGQAPAPVKLIHPASAAPVEGLMTRSLFHGVVRLLLYIPERAVLIPQLVASAERGDYAPLLAAGLSMQDRLDEEAFNQALFLAVGCAEDWRPDLDRQAVHAKAPLFGDLFDTLDSACRRLPRGKPAEIRRARVVSTAPVLLLSGGLDPVTPPAQAVAAMRSLPNSRHVVATGFGHIVTPYRCLPRLISDFVEKADASKLSQLCIDQLAASKRPTFYVSPLEARR